MRIRSCFGPVLRRRDMCAAAAMLLAPTVARAGSLRVSVAEFPDPLVTPSLLAALKIAFAKLPDVDVVFTTAPFSRSLASVAAGLADLHIPMIRPSSTDALPWALSTATIFHVPFVLYTNTQRPIDAHDLGKYHIETDAGHVGYFDFPVLGSVGSDSSLRKVEAGRIDGYIYAGNVCDPLIGSLGLKTIHRALYRTFDAAGVLPKGGVGGPTDRLLSRAMAAAEGDAAFQATISRLLTGYRGADWQP